MSFFIGVEKYALMSGTNTRDIENLRWHKYFMITGVWKKYIQKR